MLRSFFPLIIFACALSAQTKKILLRNGDAELVKEWAAVKTNARLVPVTVHPKRSVRALQGSLPIPSGALIAHATVQITNLGAVGSGRCPVMRAM